MKPHNNLQNLCAALSRLVEILAKDANCPWTPKFEADLALCQILLREGFTEEDLRKFSTSITYVFQGAGSFNDYAPASYHSETSRYAPIPGTEDFDQAATEVFNSAARLRGEQK